MDGIIKNNPVRAREQVILIKVLSVYDDSRIVAGKKFQILLENAPYRAPIILRSLGNGF